MHAEAAGQDPYLALLLYRATPINSIPPSPTKLLNQRDYHTQLPCSRRLQQSQTMECNQERLQHWQDVQKQQYDGKSLRELQKTGTRSGGVCVPTANQDLGPFRSDGKTCQLRSYIVKTAGGSKLSRNRVQLKPSGEKAPTCNEQLENNQDATSHQPTTPMATPHHALQPESPQALIKPAKSTERSDEQPLTTRSGCVVKKPSRLIEHIG